LTGTKTVINFDGLSPFGAEIKGFNVKTATDDCIQTLKQILANSCVAVLRDQPVSDAKFVAFLQQLGSLTFTAGETPVVHQPELNIVSNVNRKGLPKSVFHTDTSYVSNPPAYTALKAVKLPEAGGETLFCNQYQAFETLPVKVKQQLSDAKLLHIVSGLTLTSSEEKQAWHPLFKQHPISGRAALFLSTPERCRAIAKLDPNLGQRIIRLLYKHSIRPSRIYRHHWQPNDIVIWDNRCTMHRADHSEVVGDRILHRGLVLSETLVVS
jgi:taurine dioxygenase